MIDRDRRRVVTPPAGVAAQIAQPIDNWDDETPTPRSIPETVKTVARQVKETHGISKEIHIDISSMRDELHATIAHVDGKVERLHEHVGELAEQTANMAGKVDVLVDVLGRDRDERSVIRVAAAHARIEVDKTAEIAAVNDQMAKRAHRRTLGLKALAALGAVWATVSAAILARGC